MLIWNLLKYSYNIYQLHNLTYVNHKLCSYLLLSIRRPHCRNREPISTRMSSDFKHKTKMKWQIRYQSIMKLRIVFRPNNNKKNISFTISQLCPYTPFPLGSCLWTWSTIPQIARKPYKILLNRARIYTSKKQFQ